MLINLYHSYFCELVTNKKTNTRSVSVKSVMIWNKENHLRWRFLLYTFLFVLGNVTLYKTSPQCLSTPSTCWKGYPEKQQLNSYNYIYFQTELAFYTSCAISQFFDVKRKVCLVLKLYRCFVNVFDVLSVSQGVLNNFCFTQQCFFLSSIWFNKWKKYIYNVCHSFGQIPGKYGIFMY